MSQIWVIKDISFLWIGSLLGAGFAFVTQVIMARTLTPADFGTISAALVLINLASPMAGFGVHSFWLKAFGKEAEFATRWLPDSFRFISLSLSVVLCALLLWIILGPNDEQTQSLLVLLGLGVPAYLVVELIGTKLQLQERFAYLAFIQLVPHFSRLLWVAIAALLFVNVNAASFAAGYAMVGLITIIYGYVELSDLRNGKLIIPMRNQVTDLEQQEKPSMFRVAAESFPFGLATVFHLIYFQSAIVIISQITGPESAGLYNVAFVVMSAVYIFPSVIYQKFLLARLHYWSNYDRSRFKKIHVQGNIIMAVLGLLAMFSVWVVSPWFIDNVFGEEYSGAKQILLLLAVCAPLRFLATSVGASLVTQEHMRRKVKCMAVVAAANIVLNIMLIPKYAAMGAVYSTIFCEFLLLVVYFRLTKKYVFSS